MVKKSEIEKLEQEFEMLINSGKNIIERAKKNIKQVTKIVEKKPMNKALSKLDRDLTRLEMFEKQALLIKQYKKDLLKERIKDFEYKNVVDNFPQGYRFIQQDNFKNIVKREVINMERFSGDFVKDLNKVKLTARINLINTLKKGPFKIWFSYGCKFVKYENDEIVETDELIWFNGHTLNNRYTILRPNQIPGILNNNIATIIKRIEEFIYNGSGWVWDSSFQFDILYSKYEPQVGSSYIELPQWTYKKMINVKNTDNECFKWAILSYLHPIRKNSDRVSSYLPFKDDLNFTGMFFPITEMDYAKFERLNNMSIHVFVINDEGLTPFYEPKEVKERHCVLGLYKNHYVWIKNINACIGQTLDSHKKFPCLRCMHSFTSEKLLTAHTEDCKRNKMNEIKMPKVGENIIKFKNVKNVIESPVVITSDWECLIDENNKHIPNSFCYYIHSKYEIFKSKLRIYRGEDCVDKFFEYIKKDSSKINSLVKNSNTKMIFNASDKLSFNNATVCSLCNLDLNNDKVRDHDHFTGAYRGAAHNACNVNANDKWYKIPVVIHNLRGYDAHIIVKHLEKYGSDNISCIPNTIEKYMSFTVGNLCFIDSYQHLASSLDTLVKNLKTKGVNSFVHTSKFFKDDELDAITKKGVYPYESVKDHSVFEKVDLFNIEEFYSSLNNETISSDDYLRYIEVYKQFKCKNFGEYHDLYLKSDVLLLADVFDNYRKNIMNIYNLDPVRYITTASLAWDAMLRFTKVQLELLTDYDMLMMVEKGIRGGICMVSNRSATANNKYMFNYDSTKPNEYIIYLDANNLYGYAMVQELPKDNFKWDLNEWNTQSIMNIGKHADTGYIFEVDLEYPKHLHDKHNDYPLAVESTSFDASPFMVTQAKELDISYTKSNKLIPNLNNKVKYVVHYKNLQLYIKQGLILTKVHRAISFNQSKWLEPYINNNTSLRQKASDDFEKDLWKLMNNSVFGKTMENVRKRIDVKICSNERSAQKRVNNPLCKNIKIINKDICAIEMQRKSITMDKPIAVGMTVLDLSKVLMYEFHYDTIKTKYEDNAGLLYTDTDSLVYHIKTEDLYQDIHQMADLFDLSEYVHTHPHVFDKTNAKVIGKFKDEVQGKIIDEFIALKAKLYSFKMNEDNKTKQKGKGIKRSAMKDIKHENYQRCLNAKNREDGLQTCSFNQIKAINHQLSTIQINKISLNVFEDKRYWINNHQSYAFGHFKISELNV